MGEKFGKKLMVFQLISFELEPVNSLYWYESTRCCQSTCYQAVLKCKL